MKIDLATPYPLPARPESGKLSKRERRWKRFQAPDLDAPAPVRKMRGNLAARPAMKKRPVDEAKCFLNLFHASGIERAFNFFRYKKNGRPFFRNVKVRRWKNGEMLVETLPP